ncbi:MAG TPA: cysteine hydrolase [Xanthobacteraceae bacterium]|nr:cysteine hydrolase [Xanthobacteraceae bacterium]
MSTPYGFPQYVIDRVMQKRGKLAVYDRFEPRRTAMLVIDMQNFYVGEIASVVGIIPNINRLARHVRSVGSRVIWVGMTAGEGGKSLWPVYHDYFFTPEKGANHRDQLSPGHDGHKFHKDLDIRQGEEIVYKSRFSPFVKGASNIEDVLAAHGIDSLIVTGTATNMCCESAARDAMMLDYKVVMVADANGARYPEDHLAGLTSFYQSFGDVRSTDEVINDLMPAVRAAAE